MSRPAARLVIRRLAEVRTWPIWTLRPALRCYVLAIISVGATAAVVAAVLTSWEPGEALLFGGLLLFGGITVESLRKIGEPAGTIKDAHGVWQLPAAMLLPPFYAIAATIAVFALTQWRVRVTLAYRRVFSVAAIGLSYGAASVVFHTLSRQVSTPVRGPAAVVWIAAGAAAAILRWAINNILVLAAVRLDDPAARIRDMLGGAGGLAADVTEGSIGVVVALATAITPLVLLLALPLGTMLQRSSRHSQLVQASRTDSKTGLLTVVAWQAEAAVQFARALRTQEDLAVLMIDIDHFKQVNDTHGHLAGDEVLKKVAQRLQASRRPYDVVGRFGGEEFVLLFPGTSSAQARQLAERHHAQLGQVPVEVPGLPAAEWPHITVSIGVATSTDGMRDVDDLLRAADAALYQAKNSGRDQIQVAGEPAAPQPPGN
jgi:diguanylate cyclase (GGDEF)-like protein